MSNNYFINCIRQLRSGKIKIDHVSKSIYCPKTTWDLLNRLTETMSHNFHTPVSKWEALHSSIQNSFEQLNTSGIPNPEISKILEENEYLKKRNNILQSELDKISEAKRLQHKERMLYVRA